jgi:MFS family permease
MRIGFPFFGALAFIRFLLKCICVLQVYIKAFAYFVFRNVKSNLRRHICRLAKMNEAISSLSNAIRQKGFQAASVLVFNSFSWYFPLFVLFTDTLNQLNLGYGTLIMIFGFHYISIAGSAFLGNYLVEKIGRNKLLSLWVILGVCSSAFMLTLSFSNVLVICAISILLGVSLGLGFPSCLAYFGDNITPNRRGLIGGVTFAFTFVAIMIVGFLTIATDLTTSAIGFTIWRLIGLLLFALFKTEENLTQTKVAYFKIIREKSFLFYFVPWSIFCVVNFFQSPFFDTQLQLQYMGTNLSYAISLGEFGIGGLSMLVTGYLSDRIGRKRLIISAFAMVGVGSALLSVASQSQIVFYLYILLDGIAWGIFFLMFLLVIWGDLAQTRLKNRYYLIGIMPFIISSYISPIVIPFAGDIPLFAAFSFASFFLFLAVIPLMVAPETLPEKVMRDQDLKSYAEKALKQAKTEAGKKHKKNVDQTEVEREKNQEEQESPEDEEARKLAEKYY